MSLYDAALRLDVKEAEAKVLAGDKPRNPFEAVIFHAARDHHFIPADTNLLPWSMPAC